MAKVSTVLVLTAVSMCLLGVGLGSHGASLFRQDKKKEDESKKEDQGLLRDVSTLKSDVINLQDELRKALDALEQIDRDKQRLLSAVARGIAKTKESKFILVPEMQLTFTIARKSTAHVIFTAPQTRPTFLIPDVFKLVNDILSKKPQPPSFGAYQFQLVLDGQSQTIMSQAYVEGGEGSNWQNIVLQWVGEMSPGKHVVRVEWAINPIMNNARELTVGDNRGQRCLSLRLDTVKEAQK